MTRRTRGMVSRPGLEPQLILANGRVHTVDAHDSTVEAVAVAMGRIVAVGDSRSVLALRGRTTDVVDLAGRSLIPGLIDPHVHLADNGTAERQKLDCRDFYTNVRSLADILDTIRTQAARQDSGTWIVAHGSPMQDSRMPEGRYPNRHDLDAATSVHPVAINFGAHLTVVNSRALELAGLGKDSEPPPGGGFGRHPETGELTGMLQERAQRLIRGVLPEYDDNARKEGIIWSASKCLARGITSVHDIVVDADTVRTYQELMTEDRLPLRVTLLVRIIEAAIGRESLLNLGIHTGFGNAWLRIGGVKMSIDGGLTGRLARFSAPYVGEPCHCGLIRIPTEELESTVEAYHRAGHRVCIHAMGDVAMDMALDALDKALTAYPRTNHRHRIEHMGNNMCTPERIARIRRLDVLPIPNMSFLHYLAESLLESLGPTRMEKAFNMRQLLDAGIPLTQGSDAPGYWPVDVLRDLGTAASRRTWRGGTFEPEERLTVAEALRMCTATAAYAGFEERVKGSIEPGKLADLVVLAEDLYDVAPERIKDIPVDLTIVDGRIAYTRAA